MKTMKNTATAAFALACAALLTTSTDAGRDQGNQGQLQAPPSCSFDLTGDGIVNIEDVFAVLGEWGSCSSNSGTDDPGTARPAPPSDDSVPDTDEPEACRADLADDDGYVGANDLFAVIDHFGPCPDRNNSADNG